MSALTLQSELQLAQSEYRAGNLRSAEARVDRLLSAHPQVAEVLMAKGMVAAGRGDQAAALGWVNASLNLQAHNAEALAWAAQLSLGLARYTDAEAYARRLVGLAANDPRAYSLLANALGGLGRMHEALTAAERAAELHPRDSDYLLLKARLQMKVSLPGPAMESYKEAIALKPSSGAASELAEILLRESHPQEAIEILERLASATAPSDRPYQLLARAYTEAREFDKAAKHWSLADVMVKDRAALLQVRASAEIAVGRFQIAEGILRDAISQNLSIAANFSLLTTARKMSADDLPLIQRMEEMAANDRMPPSVASRLHFALGKSHDDLRQFGSAMVHFDEANRLSYEMSPRRRAFNRAETSAFVDFQIQHFSVERVEMLARKGRDSSLPLFVVGMLRSGTTLTETVLGCHSKIQAGGEQMFWTQRAVEFARWRPHGLELDWEMIERLGHDYLKLIDPSQEEIAYVVDKNPTNIHLSALLHCVYPNAKILHVKRHAVDNLLSLWATPFNDDLAYVGNRENLVFFYREYLRLLSHLEQVLPANSFATVHYEELTSDPQTTIPTLLQYLELPMEPACLEPERNCRAILTPSVFQARQPIHRGSQERWRNYEPWLGPFAELLEEPA